MSDNPTPEKPKSSDPNLSIPDAPSFWSELKRRKVMRVAITYGVVAWILIQVSATVFPQLGMPEWAPRMVTLLLLIGFPVALIIAWAFELTPDGIKTTQHAREDRGDEPVSKKEKRSRNWIAVGLAAGLPTLMFGVLTGVFYFKAKTAEETLAASQQAEFDRSIAVLPLTNMSPDEENAFFADGVHEDILTNLSKIEELLVIARTSTLRYRNTVKGLSEVGAELNVRYLVEGSVRRAANQVRVTVQLIDTQTEGHVWAENYDRSLDNIFAIQSEIAEAIADQLHAELSPEEVARIERLPTASQDAYDAYKQGSVDGGRLDKLYRATELDPTFAEAWAEIALLLYRDGDTDEEGLERAHRALEQARRYGQGLPHIPFAESFYYSHYLNDYEKSIERLLEALTIDPGYVPAKRVLGARLVLSGRLAEAQFQYEAVLRIDPYYASARWQLDVVYWLRGLWDKARANLRLQIEDGDEIGRDRYKLCQVDYFEDGDLPSFVTGVDSIDNNHSWLNFRRALLKRELKVAAALAGEGEFQGSLISALPGMGFGFSEELLKGLIQLELGDRAGAIEFADEALERLEPLQKSGSVEPRDLAYRAIGYALKRDRTSFERLLLEIRDLTETDNWRYRWRLHCEMLIAVSYLALEETDSAIETLEAASEIEGPMLFNRELELWFVFDKLHGNPRFDALLK